jgi:hypothetical protein
MKVNDIQWYAKYEQEMEEVKIELTESLLSDITCHDLYFMMIKYHHIHKYPRRFKKTFFYGTKNEKIRQKIRKEIYKYCVIETKETIL